MSLKFVQPSAPDINILAVRFWPDSYGGVENNLFHFTRSLADQGLGVSVLTENRANAAPTETPYPGLNIRRLPVMDAGMFWRWAEWVRLAWWIGAIRKHAPQGKLWATEPISAVAAVLAGRKADLIYNPACCAHAMDHVGQRYAAATTLRVSDRLISFDRWAYLRAPQVVISSYNLREQFASSYGKREGVHVMHHGVQQRLGFDHLAARRRWGLEPGDFVVGFVGRIDPCKGLDFLITAMERLQHPRARLLLVGAGPDRPRLERLLRFANLESRTVWTGKLADPYDAYPAMDVKVLPSMYEAYGNVIPEAMAAGLPVIGRRRDADDLMPVLVASDELIVHGHNGMLVDPHDPADLARALDELAASPALRHAMGRHARQFAREMSWENILPTHLRQMGFAPRAAAAASLAA
ncbi:MAG: glycosyltransferase family 4 protein [Planctomycetota bacterium]|nr:glycosyltransferase family 4 protein [Planctomycetota bacterium]